MVRKVLELAGWILAEDDDGSEGSRQWINPATKEARPYEDIPDAVADEMRASMGADAGKAPAGEPAGGPAERSGPPPDVSSPPPAAEQVPFRRARGIAAAPAPALNGAGRGGIGSTAGAVPEAPAPFRRERGGSAGDQVPSAGRGQGGYASAAAYGSDPYLAGAGPSPWLDEQPGYFEGAARAAEAPMFMASAGAASGDFGNGGMEAEDEEDPESLVVEPPAEVAAAMAQPPREPTLAMLAKATSSRPSANESQEKFLQRITHLHLSEKGLTALGSILHTACKSLHTLYLSGNRLHSMGALRPCLRQLHLQSNELWEVASWSRDLPSLEVLDLRENRITVVDGLDRCTALRDLCLRAQRPGSEPSGLRFSRRLLRRLAGTLEALDVARNGLKDLSPLGALRRLQRMDASDNELQAVADVAPPLRSCAGLRWLGLEGNPLCRAVSKYRDEVILLAPSLVHLDGKDIGDKERAFLVELDRRRRKRSSSRSRGASASSAGGASQRSGSAVRSSSEGPGRGLQGSSTPIPGGMQASRRGGASTGRPPSGRGGDGGVRRV
eukprot:TRINITY_DN10173_c0_g1_i1.p1 TRINITY_DN10173_c0_g1~~TRINITY_DN10173_c0_g1_i1.p1  ORF type:complete len:555 (+),score=124.36 TRINITY_DN10173_c0_g1_i1:217-1881(+)